MCRAFLNKAYVEVAGELTPDTVITSDMLTVKLNRTDTEALVEGTDYWFVDVPTKKKGKDYHLISIKPLGVYGGSREVYIPCK